MHKKEINCDCGKGAYLCDRFDGNGVVKVLFKSLATDYVRDHHLLRETGAAFLQAAMTKL